MLRKLEKMIWGHVIAAQEVKRYLQFVAFSFNSSKGNRFIICFAWLMLGYT